MSLGIAEFSGQFFQIQRFLQIAVEEVVDAVGKQPLERGVKVLALAA